MKNEDIIPLNYDPIFKTMFGDNKHISILEAFISIYFKVPLSTIKGHVTVLNGEKRLKNKNDKKQVSDIIARVTNSNDTMMLNIEVNNKFSQGLIDRNIDYLSGIFHQGLKKKEKYNDLPYSIQINFNLQEVDPNNKNIIDKYYLQNENGHQLTKKYQIHNVNVAKCHMLWYNKSTEKFSTYEQEIIKLGALIYTTKRKDFLYCLEGISMDKEIKSEMKSIMENMNDSELINMYYDKEQHEIAVKNTLIYDAKQEGIEIGKTEGIEIGKTEGIEIGKTEGIEIGKTEGIEIGKTEGIKQEKIETARKMLESNMEDELILKITGLTKEELETLK